MVTGGPVIAEGKVVHCEGCGEQFEYCERHAAGVYLFKYLADGHFWGLFQEDDLGDLVLLKRLNDTLLKFIEEFHEFGLVIVELAERSAPVGGVKYQV